MNQALKDRVYGKGTKKQLLYMAELGGMNEEQRTVLLMLHEGKSDTFIEDTMGITRETRKRIEDAISAKLSIAIFHCIDVAMDAESE